MGILKFFTGLFSVVLLTFGAQNAHSNQNDISDNPVLMGANSLNLNDQTYIAISFKNQPKWHTYWKNPGDAGLPLKIQFKLDGKVLEIESLEWPSPKRYLEEGNMWAYGYENDYSFFFKLKDSQVSALENKNIDINGTWLVCKHICIPGKKSITATFQNGMLKNADSELSVSEETLINKFSKLPLKQSFPDNLDLVLARNLKEDGLVLYYNFTNPSHFSPSNDRNLLTPFPTTPLTFTHEVIHTDSKKNIFGKLPIDWDGEYQDPPIDLPKDGRFKSPLNLKFLFTDPVSKEIKVIEKSFPSFNLTSATASEKLLTLLKKIDISKSNNKEIKKIEMVKPIENFSFMYYLLFAFLGGFILNFMPCVLPVISIKLFGLITHSSESNKRIFKHNIFYSLGILFSFVMLAISVILLKQAGSYVGWGFQLQSPLFVSVTILILFVMALNLFGLFEIVTPGGKNLGGMQLSDSFTGDFLSGVLATILSTPCSAPFLGTALTFAFSSNQFTILIMFLMIGLGLAFPFLLTAFFPKIISFFPKPGNWMNHLKKFLGLTLLLTVIWLFDIFLAQVDIKIQVYKLFFILLLTLVSFLLKKKSNKLGWFSLTLPLILFLQMSFSPMNKSNISSESSLLQEKKIRGLSWEKFSNEKLQKYLNEEHLVFIDFTAKWCFTCKINEKVVLETNEFEELVKQKNVKLLLADWTKRDEKIGKWLKDHGMAGVPAYFILDSNGKLVNLGETISLEEISNYLN